MTGLADFLITWGHSLLTWLYNVLVDLVNAAVSGFCDFILSVISLFPAGSVIPHYGDAPTSAAYTMAIQVLNWIFPVAYIINSIGLLLGGFVAYWAIAPLARWLKLLT